MFDPTDWLNPIDSLIKLGSKFVTDKDKLIEFQFKALELKQAAMTDLLHTQTYPWVDALVKLMQATVVFARPVGGALMTGFGAWCHYKGITMDVGLQALFDGAFPAWGVSRHYNKESETTVEKVKVEKKAEVAETKAKEDTKAEVAQAGAGIPNWIRE